MNDYAAFLASKQRRWSGQPIAPASLPSALFDWQAAITRWAMRKGRAAIFADCGLGKSFMQIAWATTVPGRVLILAPLAVGEQTVREAAKLGIPAVYARGMAGGADSPIVVTNYERLESFDLSAFAGVVLDESSILKAFDGKTRTKLIAAFAQTPYRLCCTATPSPNDIAELANHAEFLGLQTRAEFLATWFVHDDQGWRMKRHARQAFFRWLASWAVAFRTPSDLGYSDEGFVLPPLTIADHIIESGDTPGVLFPELGAKGLKGRLAARRGSLEGRVAAVASIVRMSWENHVLSIGGNITPRTENDDSLISAPPITGIETNASPTRADGDSTKAQSGLLSNENISGSITSTIENAIDSKAERTISRLTESPKQISSPFLSTSQADAGFAGNLQPNIDASMLTTITQPALFEESSATFVTSGSVDTKMISTSSQPLGKLTKWDTCPTRPQWLIWVGLNEESDAVARAIPGAVEISGDDDYADKKKAILGFVDGSIRVIVTKLKIAGFGLNLQHCHNMIFCGIGDSYEQYYQGLRRCWRFGQQRPVTATIVVSEAERVIVENVRRKEATADAMASELLAAMRDFEQEELSA